MKGKAEHRGWLASKEALILETAILAGVEEGRGAASPGRLTGTEAVAAIGKGERAGGRFAFGGQRKAVLAEVADEEVLSGQCIAFIFGDQLDLDPRSAARRGEFAATSAIQSCQLASRPSAGIRMGRRSG